MASSTFTIEICDEDRRRIDALVEALKKSEELSKRLEQVETCDSERCEDDDFGKFIDGMQRR